MFVCSCPQRLDKGEEKEGERQCVLLTELCKNCSRYSFLMIVAKFSSNGFNTCRMRMREGTGGGSQGVND
jgi:hypothetical protein